ncbi:MAG: hypothetical protein HYR63_24445 [Proteobacteria bacterium]|nr:hypothetical protein [Pseudomonadota bacterium]
MHWIGGIGHEPVDEQLARRQDRKKIAGDDGARQTKQIGRDPNFAIVEGDRCRRNPALGAMRIDGERMKLELRPLPVDCRRAARRRQRRPALRAFQGASRQSLPARCDSRLDSERPTRWPRLRLGVRFRGRAPERVPLFEGERSLRRHSREVRLATRELDEREIVPHRHVGRHQAQCRFHPSGGAPGLSSLVVDLSDDIVQLRVPRSRTQKLEIGFLGVGQPTPALLLERSGEDSVKFLHTCQCWPMIPGWILAMRRAKRPIDHFGAGNYRPVMAE